MAKGFIHTFIREYSLKEDICAGPVQGGPSPLIEILFLQAPDRPYFVIFETSGSTEPDVCICSEFAIVGTRHRQHDPLTETGRNRFSEVDPDEIGNTGKQLHQVV
jgi:hypothetical protein